MRERSTVDRPGSIVDGTLDGFPGRQLTLLASRCQFLVRLSYLTQPARMVRIVVAYGS